MSCTVTLGLNEILHLYINMSNITVTTGILEKAGFGLLKIMFTRVITKCRSMEYD